MPRPLLKRWVGERSKIDGRTLDLQIHAFMKFMVAQSAKRAGEPSAKAGRAGIQHLAYAGSADPVEAVSVHDRRIPGPGGDLPIRLYHPASAEGRAPGIVWLHQGGGVIGDLDTEHTVCTELAERCGAMVVSVDYRLAPEHPLAARVVDSVAAFQWVADNADGLGIDPARLAVGGSSEGGRLATIVCQERRKTGLSQPVGQILVFPGVDPESTTASMQSMAAAWPLSANTLAFFAAMQGEPPADDTWIAPLRAPSLAGLAPALIVTAGFDPLRDQGHEYAEALRAAGTTATDRCEDSLPHSFVFMGGVSREARKANARLADDVAAMLGVD
jgi:acetyl esterase/lipase